MKTGVVKRMRRAYLRDGRNAALNFINTCKKDQKGVYRDLLGNYPQFLNWCQEAGVIDDELWAQLDVEQYCYEPQAKAVFAEAKNLRTILSDVFNSLARRERPAELWLGFFNQWVKTANSHLHYQPGARGLEQYWADINEELSPPLWFITVEAMYLIDSGGSILEKVPVVRRFIPGCEQKRYT